MAHGSYDSWRGCRVGQSPVSEASELPGSQPSDGGEPGGLRGHVTEGQGTGKMRTRLGSQERQSDVVKASGVLEKGLKSHPHPPSAVISRFLFSDPF